MRSLLSKLDALRIEFGILLLSLLCTFLAKYHLLAAFKLEKYHETLLHITIPDLLFILISVLLISVLYAIKPSKWSVRIAIIGSSAIAAWSVLNYVWLIKSGAQLQPGILLLFLKDFPELLPLVINHIISGGPKFAFIIVSVIFAIAFLSWKLFRPGIVIQMPRHYIKRIVALSLTIVVLFALSFTGKSHAQSLSVESLSFSSHWFAISSVFSTLGTDRTVAANTTIPKAGQRNIIAPKDPADKPNIVVILLESISSTAAKLDDPSKTVMKNLAAFAEKGALINSTYVPVSHTTKSIWATFTATTPVIDADYIEAVPVDGTYETLPTILAQHGYRSAFFEMSKGSFECGPGLMKNMGFDWAWFRENKDDKSTHLGYMSGDDCKMIPDAVKWASESEAPFLLTVITSVTHDPFDVPASFEKPAKTSYQRYLQTVRYTDKFIADLYAALKEKSLTDNLMLCVIGDHGTAFRENNITSRWHPYQEVIQVPWVIHWPGHIIPQTVSSPRSQMDVTPTLLSLMGFGIKDANFEGINALNNTEIRRRFYFSSWYGNSPLGFIQNNRKYIFYPSTDKVFAFDLAADPAETTPITVNDAVANKIKQQVLSWQHYSRRVKIDNKAQTSQLLYNKWQTFSEGTNAWANYLDKNKSLSKSLR
ncbi:MAG: sulfatase-like hydrolase/transferase [Phycisphaerae bacterium]|nr:sulfatase-like hydrolase/transferase [Phycisphaerae bacterium]